jgi:hypothetical protein
MIESILPTAPPNHYYSIEKVSALVTKVWLCRESPSPLLEKEIYTIYCFVKGKKNLTIHKPKNAKDCFVKKFCELDELKNQSPFSLFVPKVTQLFD